MNKHGQRSVPDSCKGTTILTWRFAVKRAVATKLGSSLTTAILSLIRLSANDICWENFPSWIFVSAVASETRGVAIRCMSLDWTPRPMVSMVSGPEAPPVTAPKVRGAVNTSGILRDEFPLGLDVVGDLAGVRGLVALLRCS